MLSWYSNPLISSSLLHMYCITGIASLKHATADVFVYIISALLPEFLCFCCCSRISWHSSSAHSNILPNT